MSVGAHWELLAMCGEPLDEAFENEWFGAKRKRQWRANKARGLGARLDHLGRLSAIFLYNAGVEKGVKPFTEPLPGGLTFATTRVDARALLGTPSASGEPSGEPTSIFYSPYLWDKWESPSNGSIRLEYSEDASQIRMVILEEPKLPDPFSVDSRSTPTIISSTFSTPKARLIAAKSGTKMQPVDRSPLVTASSRLERNVTVLFQ